jgi:hypothetical protein
MRRTSKKIRTFVFLFILISVFIGYSAEAGMAMSDSPLKKGRLIVVGIDFSVGSRKITDKNQRININKKKKLAFELGKCIKPGDRVFVYQITDNSFSTNELIADVDVPHTSGWFESESAMLKREINPFAIKIRSKLGQIKKLANYHPDLTGFLRYVEKYHRPDKEENILLILSAGIEISKHIKSQTLISEGTDTVIQDLIDSKRLAYFTKWQIIKVGLTDGIDDDQLFDLYEELWKQYFEASKASYKQDISFTQLEGGKKNNPNLCKELEGTGN